MTGCKCCPSFEWAVLRHTHTGWISTLTSPQPSCVRLPWASFWSWTSVPKPGGSGCLYAFCCQFTLLVHRVSDEQWHRGNWEVALVTGKGWAKQHPFPVAHVLLQPFGRLSWGCPISKALLGKCNEAPNSDLTYHLLLSLIQASVCLWPWCHFEQSQKYHSDLIHCIDCKLIWRGPSLWIWNVKAWCEGNVLPQPWFSVSFSCSTSENRAHCELTRWLSCSQHTVGRSESPFPSLLFVGAVKKAHLSKHEALRIQVVKYTGIWIWNCQENSESTAILIVALGKLYQNAGNLLT